MQLLQIRDVGRELNSEWSPRLTVSPISLSRKASLKAREIVAARLSATSLAAFYAFFRKKSHYFGVAVPWYCCTQSACSSMNLTMPLLTWTGTVTVFFSRTPRLLDCRAFRFGGSNGLSKVAFKQIFFMDIT